MHTAPIEAYEGLVCRHARRMGSGADRITDLFMEGVRRSGVSRATRDRLEEAVGSDPQRVLIALAEWPARIVADRFEKGDARSMTHHGLPARDLALARVALVAALKRVSRADWSDDLERAWCWRLDTICDLLAQPIGESLSHAA